MHYSEAEEKSKTKKKILKMARERKYVPPHKDWCWFLSSNRGYQIPEENSFQSAESKYCQTKILC